MQIIHLRGFAFDKVSLKTSQFKRLVYKISQKLVRLSEGVFRYPGSTYTPFHLTRKETKILATEFKTSK